MCETKHLTHPAHTAPTPPSLPSLHSGHTEETSWRDFSNYAADVSDKIPRVWTLTLSANCAAGRARRDWYLVCALLELSYCIRNRVNSALQCIFHAICYNDKKVSHGSMQHCEFITTIIKFVHENIAHTNKRKFCCWAHYRVFYFRVSKILL